jgi:hypothetical protein
MQGRGRYVVRTGRGRLAGQGEARRHRQAGQGWLAVRRAGNHVEACMTRLTIRARQTSRQVDKGKQREAGRQGDVQQRRKTGRGKPEERRKQAGRAW